jgi:hypothetical protein
VVWDQFRQPLAVFDRSQRILRTVQDGCRCVDVADAVARTCAAALVAAWASRALPPAGRYSMVGYPACGLCPFVPVLVASVGGVVGTGVAGVAAVAAVAAVALGGAWGPLVQATSYCDLGL